MERDQTWIGPDGTNCSARAARVWSKQIEAIAGLTNHGQLLA